ncbi:MAG TPA: ethanolamine permease [Turneriella sp.]|nr:ethanolamine permease [Turneriella sp.]HNN01024.1 ethanolamine permease [Turneriella sp.]
MEAKTTELKRSLGPLSVWGMGVGYVISGMYFGWNLGLPQSGPYGMLVATGIITLMYVCFVLSYSELAAAIPRAGGVFVYSQRALGAFAGFIAGLAQNIEFVFAPPAIAAAIGAYLNIFFPAIEPVGFAIAAYVLFTALNIWGVKESAAFGVFITILAVVELLLFTGLTLPHFDSAAFSRNALPSGWWGILPAIPYAIWFYLAIEGVANMAEEVKNPQRDLSLGFNLSMATLVVLAVLVFLGAVGVAGWEAVVYGSTELTTSSPGKLVMSDKPLPLALMRITGPNHPMYHLLVSIGLLGLIASFHGILLVAGRTTMELSRARYLHHRFARLHHTRQTPAEALVLNMLLGIAILLSGKTAEMIVLAAFGALTIYVMALVSQLVLRQTQPGLERPFRTPLFPYVPITALVIAIFSLGAMVYFNGTLFVIYVALLAAGSIYFYLVHLRRQRDL